MRPTLGSRTDPTLRVGPDAQVNDHRTRVGLDKRLRMRARLVSAIMELWPDRGERGGVVIDDVIKAAAVSRGTFYKYFASLDEALDAIGRQHADEMTVGIMPVYDGLTSPLDRTATGLQLFLWRGAFDPVWARFVSRGDHLFHDAELLANVMVDLDNGRAAGIYRFESIEIAANFVIGSTMGGVSRFIGGKVQPILVFELVRMVLLGLGVADDAARDAIARTYRHLTVQAPLALAWWHEASNALPTAASVGTDR